MIVCITEKPKVAEDIAKILGAKIRRDGYWEGNNYCVTWTYGHLCCLKDPADYYPGWKSWSLSALPMIPPKFGIKLIDIEYIVRQFEVIKRLIEQCEYVINCGDAGQEGEVIQRWVMQKAGCTKPVKRLWVSSLTDESLRDGFSNLRNSTDYDPLYTAGLCRAIGDWILGINSTRLYSLKYGGFNQILSVGRVQTPTLALIVKRQQEIENFVPKDSWELRTKYRDVVFTAEREPFATEQEGMVVLEQIKNIPLVVGKVEKKKGKEAPPRLFDLTSLQVECNRKYGLTADQTLKCIQSLYEKKLTTYPRVDTTYLTEDIYPKCESILKALRPYAGLVQPLIGKRLPKSKKVFDNAKVTDHHAIIPTGQSIPSTLSQDEKRVFHTIALRFISVFYPDCTFEQTTVKAKVDKIGFKATGRIILDKGWKVIYESKKGEPAEALTDDETVVLPEFREGEQGPHSPLLGKRTSQPPKYYTEGSLLKAMETAGSTVEDEELREALKANGLGRPSTRSEIIEKLFKRGYIRRERKSIRATEAGIELISLIKEELLKSAKLTGMWEGKLRAIERESYSAADFVAELKQLIVSITNSVMTDPSNRRVITSQQSDTNEKKQDKATKKSTRKKKETK